MTDIDESPCAFARPASRTASAKEMALFRKRGCRVISVSTEGACPNADISICFPKAETGCPCAEVAYAQTAFLYTTTCMNYMTEAVKRAEV